MIFNKFLFFTTARCKFWSYHYITITNTWNSRTYAFCTFFKSSHNKIPFYIYGFKLLLMILLCLRTSLMLVVLKICHKIIKSFIVMSLFFKSYLVKRLVNLVKVFPASTKSKNVIQKSWRITESYACILKIFVFMFLLPISVLISFAI